MNKLIHTNTLSYKGYNTEIYTEKNLKEFLMKDSIPCLSSRFKYPEDFYNSIIFRIPKTKKHKNYKMIYSHLINPRICNHISREELIKNWEIEEKNLIAEGSVTLVNTKPDKERRKPQVRWLIIKTK